MQPDERGFGVAVVADELVNSTTARFDALNVLERTGWGAIVLPPAWYPEDVLAELLVQVAEQVQEFVRHGYHVVCVGNCEALSEPLARLGIDVPDSTIASGERTLSAFLRRRSARSIGV